MQKNSINKLVSYIINIIYIILATHAIMLAIVIVGVGLQGNAGTDLTSLYIKNLINIII